MCNKLLAAFGNSLVVQWLGLCAFTAEGVGSAPGWGTKIPQAMWHCQKKPKKHYWLFSFFSVSDIDSSWNGNPETAGPRVITGYPQPCTSPVPALTTLGCHCLGVSLSPPGP